MCFVHPLRKASLRKQPFLLAFRRQLSLRSMAALVAEVIKAGEGKAGYGSEEERGETAVFAGYVKWASEVRKSQSCNDG